MTRALRLPGMGDWYKYQTGFLEILPFKNTSLDAQGKIVKSL